MADRIKGKQIRLSDNRCVFVSRKPDGFLIEFRSKEGSITRLALSIDAMAALNVLTGAAPDDSNQIERNSREKYEKSRWQIAPELEA